MDKYLPTVFMRLLLSVDHSCVQWVRAHPTDITGTSLSLHKWPLVGLQPVNGLETQFRPGKYPLPTHLPVSDSLTLGSFSHGPANFCPSSLGSYPPTVGLVGSGPHGIAEGEPLAMSVISQKLRQRHLGRDRQKTQLSLPMAEV